MSLENQTSSSIIRQRKIRTGCPAHNCGGRCLLVAHAENGYITHLEPDDREYEACAGIDPGRGIGKIDEIGMADVSPADVFADLFDQRPVENVDLSFGCAVEQFETIVK